MKTEKIIIRRLRRIRSTLICAVSELDLRGTDDQITKAMCIIEATLDAAISGQQISPTKALKRGLVLSEQTAS